MYRPEKIDFVRMAGLMDAIIVPFAAVGMNSSDFFSCLCILLVLKSIDMYVSLCFDSLRPSKYKIYTSNDPIIIYYNNILLLFTAHTFIFFHCGHTKRHGRIL